MKLKKIILPVFLTCVLALTSTLLFGCNKSVNIKTTYKTLSETMATLKEDRGLFDSKEIIYLNTDFYLKDLIEKKSETSDYEYTPYVVLAATGLNFIDKYYSKLDGVKNGADFSSLNKSAKNLKKSYLTVKTEHEKLIEAQKYQLNYLVYNGFFYNYRISAAKFIDNIFSCANTLGKALSKNLKLASGVATEKMTKDELEFYLDYEYLKFYYDYKVIYMDSWKGIKLEGYYYELTFSNLQYFNYVVASRDKNLDMSLTDAKAVVEMFNRLDKTRQDVYKALKNFSLYKFSTTYDNQVSAYKKENSNAQIYFDCINDYFWRENSVNSLVADFLVEKAV